MLLNFNLISIITTTYNRKHTLGRLASSLSAQTSKNFEWIVVDDGSVDGTQAYIKKTRDSSEFLVSYFWQKNAGKHSALNLGVRAANGGWIFIVDSDDCLTSTAIEKIELNIQIYSNQDVVGLCFRKAFLDGQLIGRVVKNDNPMTMTPTEGGRYFGGDLAYVFKTHSMRRHVFPIFNGEKFVPELYIWNKISDDGGIIFFPKICIYLCEYLTDGYSANFKKNLKSNPRGFYLHYSRQIFREKSVFMIVKNFIRSVQCIGLIIAMRFKV